MSDEHLDIIDTPDGLLADVQSMIEQTRAGVAQAVNAGMTSLLLENWQADSERDSSGITSRLRKGNCRYAVATIGEQVWNRVFGNEPSPHDSLC